MTSAPPATALLSVLILSDGQAELTRASIESASTVTDAVLVLERGSGPAAANAGAALSCDWHDDAAAAATVTAQATRWVMVLGAGELLDIPDPDAFRAALTQCRSGAVEVRVGGGAEVRIHPPTSEAITAIGSRSSQLLDTVTVLPPGGDAVADVVPDVDVDAIIDEALTSTEPPPGTTDASPPRVPTVRDEERERERLQGLEEQRLLSIMRGDRDVCWVESDDEDEPLVTVRIATYNRGPLVVERAISSALAQTYRNIEVLVVGDACDEATEEAVRSVDDPRVRFINLGARGRYPDDRMSRWMVAGSAPMNAALGLARGSWIAPCDDDDELTPDHVEVLLRHAKRQRLEMVYSKARCEVRPDVWQEIGSEPLRSSHVSHGAVFYSLGLRFFQHSTTCWKLPEPGDWNLWRRMRDAGVHIGFLDQVTYVHYLEEHGRDPSIADAGSGVRLHLGCGPNRLQGWVNIDIDRGHRPDLVHDLSTGLPAAAASVAAIYSEHFFEHLPLATGIRLIADARRVLRPGGVMRIAMPDLTALVEHYLGDWRDQAWLRLPAYASIDTRCQMLNMALREWGHRYVYDEEDLRMRLAQAGFSDIQRWALGESSDPRLRGLETRDDSRLILEAVAT